VNAEPRVWVPLAGYAIAFVPLLPVTRVLFLYHYLTPLLFSLAFVLLWLDRSGWAQPGGLMRQRTSYVVVIGLAVIGFVLVSPLTYGFSVGGYEAAVLAHDDGHVRAVLSDQRCVLINVHFAHAITAADELSFHVVAEPAAATGVQNQLLHVEVNPRQARPSFRTGSQISRRTHW
jgi:hypothetical protein